jgi:uncharacterized protein (TIGR02145 family)/uncharacterized repeat protein (TIGR02543 family)
MTGLTKRFALLTLCAAVIAIAIVTISGCGGGNNPGGDNRFAMFSLTTAAYPEYGGTLSRDPNANTYQNGTEVVLTATPAAGFRFAGWSDTSMLQVTPLTITMTRDINITANFEPIPDNPDSRFSLNVTPTPSSGGTVSRDLDSADYAPGTEVTVTAMPNPGFIFQGWTGALTSSDSTVTITMNSNQTLIAHFAQIQHTISLGWNPEHGAVTRNPASLSYAFGTQVTVTATPNQGYTFIGWSGDTTSASETITITVDGDKELTANFELDSYELTTGASPVGGGTVTRNPNLESYAHGTQVRLTATAAEGYVFARWTDPAIPATDTVTITMNSTRVVTALFSLINTDHHTLTVHLNPTDGTGGTVSRDLDSADYAPGTEVTVTATPNLGFRFQGWTGALTSSDTSVTITMNSNQTLIANFVQIQHTITVNWNPQHGTVTRNPAALTYAFGTQVTVTATPNQGYTFTGWSGNTTSASETITITVDGDKELTANFILNEYRLTTGASPVGGGTVTRNPNLESYAPGARVRLTATPTEGYVFARWTDPAIPATDTVTITMNSDRVVTALFNLIVTDHHTLTVHLNPTDGTGGTVERSPDEPGYTLGTRVAVKAIPAPGHRFVGWTGDLNSPNEEDAITIIGDMTVTAQFQQVYTLTITPNPAEGGTVTPASGTTLHNINTNVTITATPASGYRFDGWTRTEGTGTITNTNSANTTVFLNSNTAITANFWPTRILTINTSPVGGTIRVDNTDYVTPTVVDSGGVVNISVIPPNLHGFINWTVTSGTATFGNANNEATTVTLSSDAAIVANFRPWILGELIDPRDDQIYRTVTIGTQTWMAENLNYAGEDNDAGVCYDNDEDNCDIYGRLYDWATVMGFESICNNSRCASEIQTPHHQGICPVGWHVPSDADWETLIRYVDPNASGDWDNITGMILKSRTGWHTGSGHVPGTDKFGFSALLGGQRGSTSGFSDVGRYGYWWNATESTSTTARIYNINNRSIGDNNNKGRMCSVRCVKDD